MSRKIAIIIKISDICSIASIILATDFLGGNIAIIDKICDLRLIGYLVVCAKWIVICDFALWRIYSATLSALAELT